MCNEAVKPSLLEAAIMNNRQGGRQGFGNDCPPPPPLLGGVGAGGRTLMLDWMRILNDQDQNQVQRVGGGGPMARAEGRSSTLDLIRSSSGAELQRQILLNTGAARLSSSTSQQQIFPGHLHPRFFQEQQQEQQILGIEDQMLRRETQARILQEARANVEREVQELAEARALLLRRELFRQSNETTQHNLASAATRHLLQQQRDSLPFESTFRRSSSVNGSAPSGNANSLDSFLRTAMNLVDSAPQSNHHHQQAQAAVLSPPPRPSLAMSLSSLAASPSSTHNDAIALNRSIQAAPNALDSMLVDAGTVNERLRQRQAATLASLGTNSSQQQKHSPRSMDYMAAAALAQSSSGGIGASHVEEVKESTSFDESDDEYFGGPNAAKINETSSIKKQTKTLKVDKDKDQEDPQTKTTASGVVAVATVLKCRNENFPLKLYRILYEAEKNGQSDIISFLPHGRAFMVHDQQRFATEVMPKYFAASSGTGAAGTGKINTFLKQLSLYSFQRIPQGPERGGYYHKYFIRGKRHWCGRVCRKKTRIPKAVLELQKQKTHSEGL